MITDIYVFTHLQLALHPSPDYLRNAGGEVIIRDARVPGAEQATASGLPGVSEHSHNECVDIEKDIYALES